MYLNSRHTEWVDAPKARIKGYFFYDWKDMSLMISKIEPWDDEVTEGKLPPGMGGMITVNVEEYGYTYGFKTGLCFHVLSRAVGGRPRGNIGSTYRDPQSRGGSGADAGSVLRYPTLPTIVQL